MNKVAKSMYYIKILCYIINVFAVTFDHNIASILNKRIHFFKISDPNLLNGCWMMPNRGR